MGAGWEPGMALRRWTRAQMKRPPGSIQHTLRLYGAKDNVDLEEKYKQWNLEGVLEKIECPTFLLKGREDTVLPTIEMYDRLRCRKKMRIIEPEEGLGGELHCHNDNYHIVHREVYNWLIPILFK
jgi:pimeloyl-ACP methyl ester carboxylesterase